jgi:catechol-2,3-dioxygenase
MESEKNGLSGYQVEGLSHVLLQVSDLKAAEHFYCGIVGLSVKSRGSLKDNRPLLVTHQGIGLTLASSSPPRVAQIENRNMEHIAFWVMNIDSLANRLRKNGIEPNGPVLNEYGKSLWVRDPDGNRVEFIEKR